MPMTSTYQGPSPPACTACLRSHANHAQANSQNHISSLSSHGRQGGSERYLHQSQEALAQRIRRTGSRAAEVVMTRLLQRGCGAQVLSCSWNSQRLCKRGTTRCKLAASSVPVGIEPRTPILHVIPARLLGSVRGRRHPSQSLAVQSLTKLSGGRLRCLAKVHKTSWERAGGLAWGRPGGRRRQPPPCLQRFRLAFIRPRTPWLSCAPQLRVPN